MVILAGFGNPLLDTTIKADCKQLLQKYNLKENDQREIDEATMKLLLEDIKNFPMEYTPGGCVQNTLRVFQWLCGKRNTTYMMGGIGDDENGMILKTLVESAGVTTMYQRNDKTLTGLTVAIINGENRSLVASIGAAREFSLESFNKISDNLLNNIDLIYLEGYFIPNKGICAEHVMEFSKAKNKLFAFNISAPYICKENSNLVKRFIENCDILFGNMEEYESLSQIMKFSGNTLDFALHISNININQNWKFEKMIIITNGSKDVVCIHNRDKIVKVEVPKLSHNELQDTTGAGDSFVAGFFYGLFKNCTPCMCLQYGCWAAQQIIRQVGCKVPDYLPEIDKILI